MLLKSSFFALCAFAFLALPIAGKGRVAPYNLVWNSQSANSSESMPCGAGDIGLNVWVENGDVLFYIARSGTFDENNSMLKLGRVRLRLTPNPLNGNDFIQTLDLENGCVVINGGGTKIQLWVDVFNPVIHVEIEGGSKSQMQVFYENWRYEDHELQKNESFQNSYKWAPPAGLMTKKDVVDFENNKVVFYHHNQGETIFDVVVKQQKMESVKEQLYNPLKDLTFGGTMLGKNLKAGEVTTGKYLSTRYMSWELNSIKEDKEHRFQVQLHTGKYADVSDWKLTLEKQILKYEKTEKRALESTLEWWQQYWHRSFVVMDSTVADPSSKAWEIGRNYHLFRYMLACNAYGDYPTKFNGGLFTYDPQFVTESRPFSPDFRNWGGGTFTAQNQRLVYFPMLKSGDFDMLKPQIDFYVRLLKNAELRSEVYWQHEGASFTEQIENFGLPNPSEYNWTRPEDYDPGMQYNAWLEYQWDTALEICWMALLLHQYAGQDISEYIPLIESCLTFFDAHYQYLARERGARTFDENGHIVFYPGSSCETYKMAYNATSTIVALQKVTQGLLTLKDDYLDKGKREKWQQFLDRIPPISYREIEGKRMISPAKSWERINNTEAPQLYPVYPWGTYGVGKPDIETALNTYWYDPDVQKFKNHRSWKQYNIFAARLGLSEEAKEQSILKLQDSGRRFPAFWGPGFDWVPDHNWGGSGMIGLQEMLLQTNGDSIYVFPAWPIEWDVHFKLHAPGNTTVEAQMKNGVVEIMQVEPAERQKDIRIFNSNN